MGRTPGETLQEGMRSIEPGPERSATGVRARGGVNEQRWREVIVVYAAQQHMYGLID